MWERDGVRGVLERVECWSGGVGSVRVTGSVEWRECWSGEC